MMRKFFWMMGVIGFSSVYIQADYVIQLGLYKNKALLQKEINRIDDADLRANVVIEKREELNWAHSKTIKDKKSMEQSLSQYRRYFKDAFPKEVESMEEKTEDNTSTPIVEISEIEPKPAIMVALQSADSNDTATIEEKEVVGENNETGSNVPSLAERLKSNVFYVCFESKTKQIVKIEFDEQKVNYSTIVGNRDPFEAQYDIVNDRLYMFRGEFSAESIYLTLDEVNEKYLLMSSWNKDEKADNIRYYYDLQDALAYMED